MFTIMSPQLNRHQDELSEDGLATRHEPHTIQRQQLRPSSTMSPVAESPPPPQQRLISPGSTTSNASATTSPSGSYMEHVLFKLHQKVSSFVLQRTTFNFRLVMEHFVLIVAVCCMCLLALLHISFVYHHGSHDTFYSNSKMIVGGKPTPLSCLTNLQIFNGEEATAADVTHIVLVDGDIDDYSSCFDRNITSQQEIRQRQQKQPGNASCSNQIVVGGNEKHQIFLSYSRNKGFLYFADEWRMYQQYHNITQRTVRISKSNPLCFGEPFLQTIIFNITQDPYTVGMNWLLAAASDAAALSGHGHHCFPQTGLHVYNPKTKNIVDLDKFASDYSSFFLSFGSDKDTIRKSSTESIDSITNASSSTIRLIQEKLYDLQETFFMKLSIILTSLFLFFITTTLVSFTLRETQSRMILFTWKLQLYVSQRIPHYHLICTHIIESLVFVPIMVGMMFFLIEFYNKDNDDSNGKFIAFIILSIVWICEVFSVIALRTIQGMRFFPRVFFLLFILFHVYYFSCPYGFTFLALATTIMFMIHSMIFFWNRFELPAVANGQVTNNHPRQTMEFVHPSPVASTTTHPPPPIHIHSNPSINNNSSSNNNSNENNDNSSNNHSIESAAISMNITATSSTSGSLSLVTPDDSNNQAVNAPHTTRYHHQERQQEEQQAYLPVLLSSQQQYSSTNSLVSPSVDGDGGCSRDSRSGRGSVSSTGIQFQPSHEDCDDDSSYMFFMDGEVVMHRDHQGRQLQQQQYYSDQISIRSASPLSTPPSRTNSIALPSPTDSLESLAENNSSGGSRKKGTVTRAAAPRIKSLPLCPPLANGSIAHDADLQLLDDAVTPKRKSTTASFTSTGDTSGDENSRSSGTLSTSSLKRSNSQIHYQQTVSATVRSTTPPRNKENDVITFSEESKESKSEKNHDTAYANNNQNDFNKDFNENTLTPLRGSATRQGRQEHQSRNQNKQDGTTSATEEEYVDEDPGVANNAPFFPFFSFGGNEKKKQKTYVDSNKLK